MEKRKIGTVLVSLTLIIALATVVIGCASEQEIEDNQGVQGPTGEQGIQGGQGLDGEQGEPGLQGMGGRTGEKGATGPQGIQGIQGERGLPGSPGPSGTSGQVGNLRMLGGLYGINVETLEGNKILTSGVDEIYQYLSTGFDSKVVTLDTEHAIAGDRFVIRSTGDWAGDCVLWVKQAEFTLDGLANGAVKEFIFNGSDWIGLSVGTGEAVNTDGHGGMGEGVGEGGGDHRKNLSIGYNAKGYFYGVAVGYNTGGYNKGVAVGYDANGYEKGVGIGYMADGENYGAAVGYESKGRNCGAALGFSASGELNGVAVGYLAHTNWKRYSIALGYNSRCERVGETSININGQDSDQENNVVQGRWEGETVGATPLEIFCAGYSTSRFTIRPSSVLAFRIIIVARDNVTGHVAMYTIDNGLIKRNATNETTMALATIITTVYEDDTAWNVAVTADDTNEALVITVTGDATNPVQWAVRMDGVETHF